MTITRRDTPGETKGLSGNLGDKIMASSNSKPRPAHVPEENVYESMHWLIVVTYLVAAAAVTLLIVNAG
jgi:hypothetical protein